MKSFFSAFYKSLYDAEWLKAARLASGPAWRYFCLLVLVFSLVAIVPIGLEFRDFVHGLNRSFVTSAPDFQANLKGGKLTIERLEQPFVYRSADLIVIVDTVSTSSLAVEQFVTSTNVSTLLLTANRAELRDSRTGEGKVQTWSNLPDYSFSKNDVVAMIASLAGPWSTVGAILAIFIGLYVGFFIMKLYDILLVTLLVSVFARLSGRAMKFSELFTIGLYAGTLPSILGMIAILTGVGFSYLQFLALLAFMLAMVFTKGEIESPKSKV